MIRRLRVKLIAAAMLSLLAVLVVIMTALGALNYRKVVDDADTTLALLAANGGYFPGVDREGPMGLPPQPPFSPELPYETRYFFVSLNREGEAVAADTGRIAAVDTEQAIAYARAVWSSGQSRGFWGSYRYCVTSSGEGTMVLFLDCTRSLDSFKALLLSCAAVSAAGSLLVFLLLLFLSGRIVRPFLENYEKQKRFITDAGHELKTPLTIIDADAELLEMDLGENEWLRDIQSQTRRLADLTQDLILLSRMEEGQAGLTMVEFPLSDLVEETAAAFQSVAITGERTIALRIQPMLSLRGDEKSLRKLVSILLDNALKYSPPGSAVACGLERCRGGVRLWVENPVHDLSKEQLGRLFDRFYRGDPSRSSGTKGYGLGLSIAAAIVAAHKGKLSAALEEGGVLRLTAFFPIS